jgi:uncharacterized coiled-coil protein SlyX
LVSCTLQQPAQAISREAIVSATVCGGIIALGVYAYRQDMALQKERLASVYQYAMLDFCKLLHEPNLFLQAAELQTIEPLLPLYKELVLQHTIDSGSLHMSALTQAIVDQARAQNAKYNHEYNRVLYVEDVLKKSGFYKDHADIENFKQEDFKACERTFERYTTFYDNLENIDNSFLLNNLMHEMYHELENNLIETLNNKISLSSYTIEQLKDELYKYVESLSKAQNIYAQFTLDNNLVSTQSDLLIQESDTVIQTLTASMQYTIEVKQKHISNLEYDKECLRSEVRDLEYKNREKDSTISSLNSKISSLEHEVSRLKWRTCPKCHSYV